MKLAPPGLGTRLIVVLLLFVLLPLLIYQRLEVAAAERDQLLLSSVQSEGRLIAAAIRDRLAALPPHRVAAEAQPIAEALAAPPVSVRVLFQPADGGVFLVAAAPPGDLDFAADQQRLEETGVLDVLTPDCVGVSTPLDQRYRAADGPAILTAVSTVAIGDACWLVVTASTAEAILGSGIDRPYWATQGAQLAFIIYLGMAALVMLILLDGVAGVRRFASVARRRARRDPTTPRFVDANRLPELDEAARAFDDMADSLARSAAAIRQSAEDTAHAFKAPLATIGQALDLLDRRLPTDDKASTRALGLARQSQSRLLDLVAIVRRLEDAVADQVDPPRDPVDLSRLLTDLAAAEGARAQAAGCRLVSRIAPGLTVLGSRDMLETIFDNPLENAIGFTPAGGTITLEARRRGDRVEVTIRDTGPGVPADQLEDIFQRYVSRRPPGTGGDNFGIGLWVARRNAEALGGRMTAENAPPPHGSPTSEQRPEFRGLIVTISLPRA